MTRRYVVVGGGAVGGALAAQLAPAGHDVLLLARGEHGRRVAEHGLVVRRPEGVEVVRLPVAAGPDDVDLRADDVLVLATKTQDAEAALAAWAWRPVAGPGPGGGRGRVAADLPVVTLQNGLLTEELALRRFERVYGATIAIAASYLSPGEIVSPSRPPAVGLVWLGRYLAEPDELQEELVADLVSAGFAAWSVPDVRAQKAAKLLGNVGNGLDLLAGDDRSRRRARTLLREEAVAVLAAAGMPLPPGGELDRGDVAFSVDAVEGHVAGRLSTWQSFARGASSEIDYLNGEVVLLARRHGVPAPVNAALQRLLGAAAAAGASTADGLTLDPLLARDPSLSEPPRAPASSPPGSTLLRGLGVMARASRDHPGPAALATAAGLVNGATMVLGAAAVGWATDHLALPVLSGRSVGPAAWWVGVGAILAVSAVRCTTIWVRGVATGTVQHRAQAATRRAVVHRYLHVDLGWHRRHPPGRLLAHAVSDVDAVWSPVQWLYFALGMVLMLLGALVQLAASAPAVGLVGLALVTAVLALNVAYQRLLAPRARDGQAARGEVARTAHESVEGGPVVRSLGLAGAEEARFGTEVERLRVANTRMASISAVFDPVLELLPTVAVLAVLGVGAGRVSAGEMTVGSLVGVSYLLLTVSIPLSVLSRFLSVLPLAVAGHERVESVLAAPEAAYGARGGVGPDGPARLEVRAAGVDRGGATLLHGVDVDVAPGTVCAVVGATGAGKTTLVDLVCGQLDPTRGTVLLDGEDLADLDAGRRAATLGMVGQSAFLFATSIRENLTLLGHPRHGRPYTDAEVWAALHVADASGFVQDLPAGLDSLVGERGATLSGGQRQRLCLARALLRKPRLLVLDDATSALDPRVELRVLARLRALVDAGGPTVVLVANRPASLAVADRVLFLAGGRVVDAGTPAEVAARDGDYRDLVTAYDDAGPDHDRGRGVADDGRAVLAR